MKNLVSGSTAAIHNQTILEQVELMRFTDNGDGTVTDTQTGLIWQQADDGVLRDWEDANEYCTDLVLGGYSDWSLPSLDELKSIVDESRVAPACDPVFYCRCSNYWLCSTYIYGPPGGWYVNFYFGYVSADHKTDYNRYVRCVRGGP
jgi:hypothetical protein